MILQKLTKKKLDDFTHSAISISKLKSIGGGFKFTKFNQATDFIDDNNKTKYDCDTNKYDDSCEVNEM